MKQVGVESDAARPTVPPVRMEFECCTIRSIVDAIPPFVFRWTSWVGPRAAEIRYIGEGVREFTVLFAVAVDLLLNHLQRHPRMTLSPADVSLVAKVIPRGNIEDGEYGRTAQNGDWGVANQSSLPSISLHNH